MRPGVGLSALLSHWGRHPFQLAMLLVGLSLATALWSGVQAINAEALDPATRDAGIAEDMARIAAGLTAIAAKMAG